MSTLDTFFEIRLNFTEYEKRYTKLLSSKSKNRGCG